MGGESKVVRYEAYQVSLHQRRRELWEGQPLTIGIYDDHTGTDTYIIQRLEPAMAVLFSGRSLEWHRDIPSMYLYFW